MTVFSSGRAARLVALTPIPMLPSLLSRISAASSAGSENERGRRERERERERERHQREDGWHWSSASQDTLYSPWSTRLTKMSPGPCPKRWTNACARKVPSSTARMQWTTEITAQTVTRWDKMVTVIAEISTHVQNSYSSFHELSYAINFRTARAVSHSLHSIRVWLSYATKFRTFSQTRMKYTKLNRVWKFLQLQYDIILLVTLW